MAAVNGIVVDKN